jgi:predicted O-methyltransferase YrrM
MFDFREGGDTDRFARAAESYFNPFTARSGTYWTARLLSNLIVSQRVQTAVEFGAGYTSLFIARALREVDARFSDEKAALLQKCAALLDRLRATGERIDPDMSPSPQLTLQIYDFLDKGGETSCLDPIYYLERNSPRLYCFEQSPEISKYFEKLISSQYELDLWSYIDLNPSATIELYAKKLDDISGYIDLFWFDCGPYTELFRRSWRRLRAGGTMVFHRGTPKLGADIDWILKSRSDQNDISFYELIEPNKIMQNGAYILQKRIAASDRQTWSSQPSAMTILQSIDNLVRAEDASAKSIFDQNCRN